MTLAEALEVLEVGKTTAIHPSTGATFDFVAVPVAISVVNKLVATVEKHAEMVNDRAAKITLLAGELEQELRAIDQHLDRRDALSNATTRLDKISVLLKLAQSKDPKGELAKLHCALDVEVENRQKLEATLRRVTQELEAVTDHLESVMRGPMIQGQGIVFKDGVEGIPTIKSARAVLATLTGRSPTEAWQRDVPDEQR